MKSRGIDVPCERSSAAERLLKARRLDSRKRVRHFIPDPPDPPYEKRVVFNFGLIAPGELGTASITPEQSIILWGDTRCEFAFPLCSGWWEIVDVIVGTQRQLLVPISLAAFVQCWEHLTRLVVHSGEPILIRVRSLAPLPQAMRLMFCPVYLGDRK